MLSLLFWFFVIVVLAFVVFGYLLPDKVHIVRSTIINAPADKVFAHISDFNKWDAWSPWAKIDPDAKFEITGEGIGQRMAWSSTHREVMTGAQEIVELSPPHKMKSALDFGDMGVAHATFTLESPSQGATRVSWALDTNMREGVPVLRQPMATYMGFFMDKFMDKPYTEGLAKLKEVVEAE